MDIGGLPPTLAASARVSDTGTARTAQSAGAQVVPKGQASAAVQKVLTQAVRSSLPENFDVRVELDRDEPSGRVFARVIDRTTGRVIHQFPPEELLALFAKTREMLGPLYDTKA